jgi:hypothetical protein
MPDRIAGLARSSGRLAIDTEFVCDNADCQAYGERIDP